MANNIISKIQLPNGGEVYDIYDAGAIHSLEDLALTQAMRFLGVKNTYDELPVLNEIGDVWHVKEASAEYVWNGSQWEELGSVHDAASSTHIHNVSVEGENAPSAVTGQVAVPTIESTIKYLQASSVKPNIDTTTESVLSSNTSFNVSGGDVSTKNIKATISNVSVGGDKVSAITGFNSHITNNALGTEATFKVTGGAAKTSKMETTQINNITGQQTTKIAGTNNSPVKASKLEKAGSVGSAGRAASWSASVSNDGILSFAWTANTPTGLPTMPTFTEVDASYITTDTAKDVTVVTSITTEQQTLATGQVSANAAGAEIATGINSIGVEIDNADTVAAITNLGTATTKEVLTSVSVSQQPTVTLGEGTGNGSIEIVTGVSDISVSAAAGSGVNVLKTVDVQSSAITLTQQANATEGAVPMVSNLTIDSTLVGLQNGQAAAQVWKQTSGVTAEPQS